MAEIEKRGYVETLREELKRKRENGDNQIELTVSIDLSSPAAEMKKTINFQIPTPLRNFKVGDEWADCISKEIRGLFYSCIQESGKYEILSNEGIELISAGKIPSNEIAASSNSAETEAERINTKFQMGSGSFVGHYGDQELFFKGLDDMIGLPDFRVESAIMNEHLSSGDSLDLFRTSNYGGTETSPAIEYEYVTAPDLVKVYPGMTGSYARRPVQLQELMKNQTFIDSGLTRAELVALRLFTGPMFMKYNCVLRGYPQEIARNLKGNRYITTIHTIASGIVKLSRVAELPENRKVYRGLGGMILPEKFWKPDKYGCRGGVEYGFMSTTTQRDVALMYSGKEGQLRTIFEMDVGQIDRGANIQWLSQYPAEKEFLVPPLSNLEVIDQPRLEMHEDGTQILIIRLRVNVNFRSKTLEQLKATRKRLHLATMGNLIADTKRKLCVPDDDPDGILASFYRLLEEERGKADEWFNDDANYRKCQEDMMGLKMGTIRQDQLIRLARRCLLGEPSDEIDQRDIELSLKEVMGLDSGAGMAVGGEEVPRAVLKDEEITDEELNKLKELLVVLSARNPRLTLFSGKQSSSIHMGRLSSSETDRMLRMLFRVFVHYECSRGGAEGRDITSWLHLLETDADVQRDVERDVERVMRQTESRAAVFAQADRALALKRKIEMESAVGMRIAKRERESRTELRTALESRAEGVRKRVLGAGPLLRLCLLEDDDHERGLPDL